MATETKKTEAAAAAAPPIEARCLTLRQKLVEMRKACPEIVKKKHSEGVKYKYAKIYDVWEKITPIMNELGVDFEVVGEKATRYHLIAVSGGGSTVYGWTDAADIKTSGSTATSYLVKVTTDVLNIRKGPGTNYETNGAIRDKGTYTIVAESDGPGASKWGKLKSGAGWISLDYAKKV